jgi:hypothetical protein
MEVPSVAVKPGMFVARVTGTSMKRRTMRLDLDGGLGSCEDVSRAAPGAETEGRAVARNGTDRPSLSGSAPMRYTFAAGGCESSGMEPHALLLRIALAIPVHAEPLN